MLHGYPDTAFSWRHLGPVLAENGFRAVAPFMRGYHPTAIPADGSYEVGALASDALGAHEVLGGDERAVLIGHDWGAEAAYCADAFSPGTFRRVIGMAVPPGPVFSDLPKHPVLAARQTKASWYIGFQQMPGTERLLGRIIPKLWREWSPGYTDKEDMRRCLGALAPPGHRTAALGYYRAIWRQPQATSRKYRAEQKKALSLGPAPTLYLHGEDDGCILADVARLAEPYVETEIVPGVGHFLHLEDPDRVNARILEFVSG